MNFHPVVIFFYFSSVIGFAMFLMHPVFIGISFVCAAAYSIYLSGGKSIKAGLKFMLPMMILAAAVNPMFNHRGVTILAYLPNGNPLTLESVFFGIAAAFMLAAVITWFSCLNVVMTSDKFLYLFRIMPVLSLILSMSLRLVPRFRSRIKIISQAQKGIGRDVSQGNFFQKARHGIKILSILVTWALENSIETADSMKARGYGLPGRTAFSIFRFTRRDFFSLLYMAACVGAVFFAVASGAYYFRYFPSIRGSRSGFAFAAYIFLCAFPIFVSLKDDAIWKYTKLKI